MTPIEKVARAIEGVDPGYSIPTDEMIRAGIESRYVYGNMPQIYTAEDVQNAMREDWQAMIGAALKEE